MRRIISVMFCLGAIVASTLPATGQVIINGRQLYPLIDQQVITVTIANGSALSGVAAIPEGYRLCGLEMPSAWTSAAITFAVATSYSGTFQKFADWDGTEVTIASPAASVRYALDPTRFYGVRYLKVRSGTAATPVNQGADRVITLILRPY